jgi:hypothetical protein
VGERMEKKDWCVFEIRIESHSYYKVVWYLGVEAAFYSADAIMLWMAYQVAVASIIW